MINNDELIEFVTLTHDEVVHNTRSIGGVQQRRYRYGMHVWKVEIAYQPLSESEFKSRFASLIMALTRESTIIAMPRTRLSDSAWPETFFDFTYVDDNSIHCRGWTNGFLVPKGELFLMRGKMHVITDDCVADGTGAMILKFYPPMQKRFSLFDLWGVVEHGTGDASHGNGDTSYHGSDVAILFTGMLTGDVTFEKRGHLYTIGNVVYTESNLYEVY